MTRTAVVLDKDPFFREFQRVLLRAQGFDVVAPSEPHEFTAAHVLRLSPALIITEILLPGTNGLDVVRELRASPDLGDCPIVVFSVLHAEARAMAAGADSFVQKPLMRQDYLSTVIDTLNDGPDEATS